MSRKKIWEKKKRFPKENRASFKKKNIKSLKKQGLLAEGVFIGNARGFGFVETGEDEEDIFIPADAVNTALHQDRVQVLLEKRTEAWKAQRGNGYKNSGKRYHRGCGNFSARRRLWLCAL